MPKAVQPYGLIGFLFETIPFWNKMCYHSQSGVVISYPIGPANTPKAFLLRS